jgi:hypothetical protein
MVSIAAAAMGGLLTGSAALAASPAGTIVPADAASSNYSPVTGVQTVHLDDNDKTKSTEQLPKHDCKGVNDCKGQGGCKASDNGCKAKNSCKGKGGCNTNADKPSEGDSNGM